MAFIQEIINLKYHCFQHDMAYIDFKCLNRRAAANKVLRDKAANIAKNPK